MSWKSEEAGEREANSLNFVFFPAEKGAKTLPIIDAC